MVNPKMEYEGMSGAFIWEDEGLWEVRNRHLSNAFKYVIHHRMRMVARLDEDEEVLRSKKFDQKIFEMAKKYFPNWIGFDASRCSYNPELADRMIRIRKVAHWRCEKLFNEEF
ncbi:hypothetical protein [Spongiimicrobium salis]|uniref:hypothetical protein n=1 Tax=Spongiimicrobium salis TaxID=1667022 RepID=UPI00374D994E